MVSRTYQITLKGETPLLMHNDNIQWADSMKAWGKDPANKKVSEAGDDRTPAWRWIGSLYTDAGVVCMPSDNLMTMMRDGGARCPTGKRGQTFKRQTQSGIVVDQASWPLCGAKGIISSEWIKELIEVPDFDKQCSTVAELGFSLFVKRAPIGNSKHVRVRPRFDVWSCSGTVTVLDETITYDVLSNIINYAGAFAGLGDWRASAPHSPGRWGKFTAEVKVA